MAVTDIGLTTPDVQKIATKASIDLGALEAHVPLVNDAGEFVRTKSFGIDLTDPSHPQAVRNKVRQAIIDMAVYLGIIPPQP